MTIVLVVGWFAVIVVSYVGAERFLKKIGML